MAIFIRYNKERAVKLAPEPHDGCVEHLVKTWSDATLKHCFDGRGRFQKAVRRNWKALQLDAETIVISKNYGMFFSPRYFKFSTKAPHRKETLYFDDGQRTGRLRQQHRKGPLAKIDHHRRIRLFFSQDTLKALSRGPKKRPASCRVELKPRDGTHLVELEWDGVSIKKWHVSGGKVSRSQTDLDGRIDQALQNILGISVGKRREGL